MPRRPRSPRRASRRGATFRLGPRAANLRGPRGPRAARRRGRAVPRSAPGPPRRGYVRASENTSRAVLQKAGRSSDFRLVTRTLGPDVLTCTCSSTHVPPALRMSVCRLGHDVRLRPRGRRPAAGGRRPARIRPTRRRRARGPPRPRPVRGRRFLAEYPGRAGGGASAPRPSPSRSVAPAPRAGPPARRPRAS